MRAMVHGILILLAVKRNYEDWEYVKALRFKNLLNFDRFLCLCYLLISNNIIFAVVEKTHEQTTELFWNRISNNKQRSTPFP